MSNQKQTLGCSDFSNRNYRERCASRCSEHPKALAYPGFQEYFPKEKRLEFLLYQVMF